MKKIWCSFFFSQNLSKQVLELTSLLNTQAGVIEKLEKSNQFLKTSFINLQREHEHLKGELPVKTRPHKTLIIHFEITIIF